MKRDIFIVLGALSAAIAVALGAFNAHSLRSVLSPALLATFETGVRHQMYHAIGLILTGIILRQRCGRPRLAVAAGWIFVAGTALFSGSLYALSLSGISTFGAITPLGGLAFIAGWTMLALSMLPRRSPPSDGDGTI